MCGRDGRLAGIPSARRKGLFLFGIRQGGEKVKFSGVLVGGVGSDLVSQLTTTIHSVFLIMTDLRHLETKKVLGFSVF